MKSLLIVKAVIEIFAGLAFALFPSGIIFILLGEPLETPASISTVRMFAAAILALGLACWLSRNDGESPAATGLITALLFYDAAFVVVLLSAHWGMGLTGVGLWPVVGLHSVLAGLSIFCLWRRIILKA